MGNKSAIEQIIEAGVSSNDAVSAFSYFFSKLHTPMPANHANTDIGLDIHKAINQCILESHPALRAYKNQVLLMMPIWAIKILEYEHFKSALAFYRGYSVVAGYENKIILYHPNVSIFGKEPQVYHEVDISDLKQTVIRRSHEPHTS